MARALIDPINLAQKTKIENADKLWSLIDYASLQGTGRRRTSTATVNATSPSQEGTLNAQQAYDAVTIDSSPSSMMYSNFNDPYAIRHNEMQSYLGDDMGGLWAEVFTNNQRPMGNV